MCLRPARGLPRLPIPACQPSNPSQVMLGPPQAPVADCAAGLYREAAAVPRDAVVNADLNCTLSPIEIAHSGGSQPRGAAQTSCRLGRRGRGDGGLTGAVARRVARARCSRIR